MWDNSDIRQKIRIRNKVFDYFDKVDKVVEFYAGEGALTKQFWSKISKEVSCIDKQCIKLNKIKLENVTTYCGDNIDFIDQFAGVEIVDCDAYGLVIDFIRQVLEVSKTDKKLIFFTDGFYKVQKNLKHLPYTFDDLINEIKPDAYHYEKANGGNVYYGWVYYENLL